MTNDDLIVTNLPYGANTSGRGTSATQLPTCWDNEACPIKAVFHDQYPKKNPRRHKRTQGLGQWDTLFSLKKEKKDKREYDPYQSLYIKVFSRSVPVPLTQEISLSNVFGVIPSFLLGRGTAQW